MCIRLLSQGSFRSDDKQAQRERSKKCWINFRIRSAKIAQINKKKIAQGSPFFGNSGIQWSNFEDFLGRFSVIEESYSIWFTRGGTKRFFSLCVAAREANFSTFTSTFVHKAFYSYVLWLVKVSIELLFFLAQNENLNVAQWRKKINYLRIGFVWLELDFVTTQLIINWINGRKKVSVRRLGDIRELRRRFRVNFFDTQRCDAISYHEFPSESSHNFFWHHNRNGSTTIFDCVGEVRNIKNTKEKSLN